MHAYPPPYDANGIDLSLIDACLALTPTQRLERHEAVRETMRELQAAFARRRDEGAPRAR